MKKIKWILVRIKKRIAAVIADSTYRTLESLPHAKLLLMPSAYNLNDEETIAKLEEQALERKRQEMVQTLERMNEIIEEYARQKNLDNDNWRKTIDMI